MSEIRSIFAYVENKCYDGLYDAAARYIARNWNNMDLESPRVPDIHTAELADAWVRRVYVSDLPGDYISFDVGMEVQIAVSATDHHRDYNDDLFEWLRISCEGNLANGLDDWRVTRICVYSKQPFSENSMSDALVPDIRNGRMDAVATEFLQKYYPEALQITAPVDPPVYVDPQVLADRLGLRVVTRSIQKDGTVFGQLFFDDADTELYLTMRYYLQQEIIHKWSLPEYFCSTTTQAQWADFIRKHYDLRKIYTHKHWTNSRIRYVRNFYQTITQDQEPPKL